MSDQPVPFAASSYLFPPLSFNSLQPWEAEAISTRLAAMDPWKRLGYGATALNRYLAGPDPGLKRFTVGEADEQRAVVCMRYPWLRGPYLELLAVFPSAQGQGVGKSILAWIEEQARLHSKNLWTMTSEFNLRARAFYQAVGFVEIAPLPDLVAEGYNEILLRKTLTAQILKP
jgi:GNAT superfamily N-acetyltransferase